MPVVGHHAKSQQPHPDPIACLLQHFLERRIVLHTLKKRASPHGSIEHMVHVSPGCYTRTPWHPFRLPKSIARCNRNETRPHLLPSPIMTPAPVVAPAPVLTPQAVMYPGTVVYPAPAYVPARVYYRPARGVYRVVVPY